MRLFIFPHLNTSSILIATAVCWLATSASVVTAANFAFTANAHDYSVSTYTVDNASGALRHLNHTPVPKMPSAVVVHPSNRFVYVVSKTPDTIAGFQFDAVNGNLSPIPGSPFAAQARSPFAMAFHPSGRFAYVAARFAGVGAYRVNEQTGELMPLPGSPFKAQERTRSVVVHPSGQYVYAANGYSNSISAYQIDQQSGSLKELPGSPFKIANIGNIDYKAQYMEGVPEGAGGIPYHIALDPEGRFAYIANWAAGSVSVMRIDESTGVLETVKGSPFFSGFNSYSVSVHPTGKFVYVAQWSSSEIMVHAVDEVSGKLTPVVGAPFPSGAEGPVSVVFNVDGRRAYVPHYESDEVAQFDVDVRTGALSFVERVSTRLSPWSMAMVNGPKNISAQTQKVLLAMGGTEISVIDFPDNAKATEAVKNSPVGQSDLVALAGNPSKPIIYAVDKANDKLLTYKIDKKNQGVVSVADSAVATGKLPVDIAIDANGWFVYVANASSNSLSVYYSDPNTGIAKPMRGAALPTGKRPVSVSLDPASRFLFVVNAGSNTVSVFRHFSSVEALTLESKKFGSPFSTGKEPTELAVDPAGHFAYVANAGSNTVSAFRIDHNSGALSELPGSPFKAGQRPVDLQVHPKGQWLYVANQDSSTLTVHRIEAGLGALANNMETVALPVQPVGVWFDESDNSILVLGKDRLRVLRYSVNNQSGVLSLKSDKQLSQPVYDFAFIKG